MTDPVARPKIMNVKRIDFEKGSRGTLVGAEYHCEHGGDHTTVFRVLNAQQPSELTITVEFPYVGRIYRTDRVVREGTGTRIDTAVYWDEPKGIKLKVGALVAVRMMKKYFGDYDDRMDMMLREPAPGANAASAGGAPPALAREHAPGVASREGHDREHRVHPGRVRERARVGDVQSTRAADGAVGIAHAVTTVPHPGRAHLMRAEHPDGVGRDAASRDRVGERPDIAARLDRERPGVERADLPRAGREVHLRGLDDRAHAHRRVRPSDGI